MDKTVQALKNLYVAKGGSELAVENVSRIPDMIDALASQEAIAAIAVAAETNSVFGTDPATMQTGLSISGYKITGTLHKLTTGAIPAVWGEGYFMALKFTDTNSADSIKVGLNPSVSSGLVELDSDMNGVFKVTDKNTQKFEILTKKGTYELVQLYDLSELVLSDD